MTNEKIQIHIKNNHGSPETFPPTKEGEKVFTITEEHFQSACERHPNVADQIGAVIDWDLDNFFQSMKTSDVLVTWDLPTESLSTVAPRLKLIHIIGAGVEHLCPMNWVPEGVTVVNNRGVHAEKGSEFGLMSVLMLNNRMINYSLGITVLQSISRKNTCGDWCWKHRWCSGAKMCKAENECYRGQSARPANC